MLTDAGRKAAAQLCSASVVSSGETIFITKPRAHVMKRRLSPAFMEMRKPQGGESGCEQVCNANLATLVAFQMRCAHRTSQWTQILENLLGVRIVRRAG